MNLESYACIEKLSALSIGIPFFLCFFKIKALNKSLWALFLYLFFCLISDGLGWIYPNIQKKLLFNGFTIIEYCLVSFLYYQQFSNNKIRNCISILSLAFLLLCAVIFIFKEKYNAVDSILSPIESALISFFGGIYIVKITLDSGTEKLSKQHFYWINLGFLLYFSVSVLLFLSNDFLDNCKPTTLYLLWGIHLILNTTKNLLIAIGIWMKRNTQY